MEISKFGRAPFCKIKNNPSMKKIFLLAALLLSVSFAQAQIWDKIKRKAEDKIIQKAEDALNGKNKKTADKLVETSGDNPGNEVQVKRNFDFIPGNKPIYAEDFSSTPEGTPPSGWKFSGTAEITTLSQIPGKWLMLNHKVSATKELLQPFPENCTIEFQVFTSNLGFSQHGAALDASPQLELYLGSAPNNQCKLIIDYAYGRIHYLVTGLNNTENSTTYSLVDYKARPLTVRISINKQRLRVWMDETKVVDLAEVIGAKILQSGAFRFFCYPRSARESYPFISNIRIADAGLSERDLSVGGLEEPKTTKTPATTTKPQPNSTPSAPKAGTMSIKDFGTYHALLIAVEDYVDPSVNKLDNPVKDAMQLQKTLTTAYHFDPQNVKLLKNPSKKEVFTELARLRTAVKETDNLLVFYAGHGYWDKDMEKGYWLPTDAERDLPTNWIANEDVTGYVRAIKSKHTLLISDACFSGGIFKTREAFTGQRAVEEVYKMSSRKAITSGNLTLVPDKSVFIQYLVKKLEENKEKFLTEEQLFSQFKMAVMNNSPGQIPQFGTIINTGDEGGNFVFIRK
jgi:Caspase domain